MKRRGGLPDISTPALLLERTVLERNLERMSKRAHRLHADLRPHLKTAKCDRIAQLATQGHSGAIAVSTLREAEYFASCGWRDILYAITITPDKAPRLAAIQRRHDVVVGLLTDDPGVAAVLGEQAADLRSALSVFIEIDCGYHRSGVSPQSDLLIELSRVISESPHLSLRGVVTHAGHSYGVERPEIERIVEEERRAAVEAASAIRETGPACPVVSIGSTPTALAAQRLEGVTELRPGNYMFFDLAMCGRGLCRLDDIAVSVLATVISHQREQGHALVDAGALALSKDLSAHEGPLRGVGYGLVRGGSGDPDLVVHSVSQEQGRVVCLDGSAFPFERFPIGSRLRILPNHSCLTCAAYEDYVVIEEGDVVDVWQRENGW